MKRFYIKTKFPASLEKLKDKETVFLPFCIVTNAGG